MLGAAGMLHMTRVAKMPLRHDSLKVVSAFGLLLRSLSLDLTSLEIAVLCPYAFSINGGLGLCCSCCLYCYHARLCAGLRCQWRERQ